MNTSPIGETAHSESNPYQTPVSDPELVSGSWNEAAATISRLLMARRKWVVTVALVSFLPAVTLSIAAASPFVFLASGSVPGFREMLASLANGGVGVLIGISSLLGLRLTRRVTLYSRQPTISGLEQVIAAQNDVWISYASIVLLLLVLLVISSII